MRKYRDVRVLLETLLGRAEYDYVSSRTPITTPLNCKQPSVVKQTRFHPSRQLSCLEACTTHSQDYVDRYG